MKKIISFVAVLMLLLGLCACGGESTQPPAEPENGAQETVPEEMTPAQAVIADFVQKAESGDYADAAQLAEAMSTSETLPFMGAFMEVEEGYLNGFTEEISGFKGGAMFGPAIGSIPFIGYVFEVEDDADGFIQTLKDCADLRWNVCTQADEMQAGVSGNYVCFVMSPVEFEN